MDRFGPTGNVSKKLVHLLRWSSFPGRTGLNFGRMDRAPELVPSNLLVVKDAYNQNYNLGIIKKFARYTTSRHAMNTGTMFC